MLLYPCHIFLRLCLLFHLLLPPPHLRLLLVLLPLSLLTDLFPTSQYPPPSFPLIFIALSLLAPLPLPLLFLHHLILLIPPLLIPHIYV